MTILGVAHAEEADPGVDDVLHLVGVASAVLCLCCRGASFKAGGLDGSELSWSVVGLDAGRRVDWVAAIDPNNSIQDALGSTIEVTEPSVHSLRPLRLRGQPHPFVEVIGTTHMGHGNLYLYEFLVDRRELRLKLCTFVLDRHADDSLISGGGVLARAYRDVNDDGYADVEIHATATFRSNPEAAGAEEVSLRRVFLWSTETECFEEDRSARKGFERVYPGRS